MANMWVEFDVFLLSLASRGFSSGTPVFPSPQKPTVPNIPTRSVKRVLKMAALRL